MTLRPSIIHSVLVPLLFTWVCTLTAAPAFTLNDGDRVVFLGDTLIEQEQHHGWIELMLTTRFPEHDISFRNLGWSADTPAGDSRLGLSLFQATKSPPGEGWNRYLKQLESVDPDVAFIAYGMANSFPHSVNPSIFEKNYEQLLTALRDISPDIRIILLGPIPHEDLGPPWPNPDTHNAELERVNDTVRSLALRHGLDFVSFFEADLIRAAAQTTEHLTTNGIHPHGAGYQVLAKVMEDHLFPAPGVWRSSTEVEPLRAAIIAKNTWFFHQSRPANMAYIFGFRKHEQGQNASEISAFTPLIKNEEKRIAKLRQLRPTAASIPTLPLAESTEESPLQPHPTLITDPELEVTLWAESPLLKKPIHMNFDAQGRLLVATSEIYPHIQPGQPSIDQIVMLEDQGGTGRADYSTVFAGGLMMPTGVLPGNGGVYVAQATELLHFRDTDNDGRADERHVVLSGFGTEDTHHNLHTLTWGPDSRMYLNQSNNIRTNIETPFGVVRHETSGIFRFDPRDQQLGVMFKGWINPWGHAFDRYGQSFTTDGAGSSGINWAVRGATYRTIAPTRRTLGSISPGSYPKFCGLEIVESSLFPADWQGDFITCDFRAHRIVRFKKTDNGAGYITQEMPDLVRSTTNTFRPVDVKLGPDGALYVADWANPIIQHGEVDFRDPRRDREHGRIWRIAPKNRPPLPRIDYTRQPTSQLLDSLLADDSHARNNARRVLIERGREHVLPALNAWSRTQTTDDGKLAAMWLYRGFNQAPPTLNATLAHAADPRIRAAAARTLNAPKDLPLLASLVVDADPRVRLEAVRSLGQLQTSSAAFTALKALSKPIDPFLDYAIWLTINELSEPLATALVSGDGSTNLSDAELEYALNALEPAAAGPVLHSLLAHHSIPPDGAGPWISLIGSAGLAPELRRLFDLLTQEHFHETAAMKALAALTEAARLRNVRPTGELTGLTPFLKSKSGSIRSAAIQLAGLWQSRENTEVIIATAATPETRAAERAIAFEALLAIGGESIRANLKAMADKGATGPIRRAAALSLARVDPVSAVPALLRLVQEPDAADGGPEQALDFWRQLLAIQAVDTALAAALSQSPISENAARAGLRAARETRPDPMLVQALKAAAGLSISQQEITPSEMQRLAALAVANGNPARGELIYRRQELACVSCHAIGGVGGSVGPDLTSIGASAQPDYLLESLINPNIRTKEGYLAVQITTKDRQMLNGMVVMETEQEIQLRSFNNEVVSIPRSNIESRQDIGSLMPSGLVENLLQEELNDLVKFLSVLGKVPAFDATRGGIAREWKFYSVTSANQALGIEGVVAGDSTLTDWQPIVALVSGMVPRGEIQNQLSRKQSRGLFCAIRFRSVEAGPTKFNLTGKIIGAWFNGTPIDTDPNFEVNSVPGTHTLVFQLSQNDLPEILKLQSTNAQFLTP